MPIEPPSSPWTFVDPVTAGIDEEVDDLVGMGADLAPATLLSAYRAGLFPMPGGDVADPSTIDEPVQWFSPVWRGILPLDGLRVTRSLRKTAKRFEIRIDTAFDEVVAACGNPARDGAWIDRSIKEAYGELHRLGWAHSIEAWSAEGELAGGLYGVSIGGLFAGESMFHHQRDASKAALIGLVDHLTADGVEGRLLDVQWQTEHLETLGVIEVERSDYIAMLGEALELPAPTWPND